MQWSIQMESTKVPCDDLHGFRESMRIWAGWLMNLSNELNSAVELTGPDWVSKTTQTDEITGNHVAWVVMPKDEPDDSQLEEWRLPRSVECPVVSEII